MLTVAVLTHEEYLQYKNTSLGENADILLIAPSAKDGDLFVRKNRIDEAEFFIPPDKLGLWLRERWFSRIEQKGEN